MSLVIMEEEGRRKREEGRRKKEEGRKRREKQKTEKILLFLSSNSQSILKSCSFISFFLRVLRVLAVR
ncbi:hypothetical protein [Microcoleus asticus]|uniref:hypothetical protein n=1 Tax=Microcoleus asticus TaxID=2815231 RepID=UPI001557CB53|nr:hypothetical protein [Microcoleus asticus]